MNDSKLIYEAMYSVKESHHCIHATKGCDCGECVECKANQKSENAESPFHYDASQHLMQAAVQINKILQSNSDDEATPEHIEQMALKILGPQSEYRDYNEFNKALEGIKALLNRYIVVSMNEGEESMPNTAQLPAGSGGIQLRLS